MPLSKLSSREGLPRNTAATWSCLHGLKLPLPSTEWSVDNDCHCLGLALFTSIISRPAQQLAPRGLTKQLVN